MHMHRNTFSRSMSELQVNAEKFRPGHKPKPQPKPHTKMAVRSVTRTSNNWTPPWAKNQPGA
jgi:hypothetical protein